METVKILVFLLCGLAFSVWGLWVALRTEDHKEAKKHESGERQPPLPDT